MIDLFATLDARMTIHNTTKISEAIHTITHLFTLMHYSISILNFFSTTPSVLITPLFYLLLFLRTLYITFSTIIFYYLILYIYGKGVMVTVLDDV